MRHVAWILTACFFGVAGWRTTLLRAAEPGDPELPPATMPAKPLPPGVRVERDIKYGDAPGKSNLLDLYLPKDAPASPLPLIVYIHGGGWRAGDKAPCSAASFMVPQGYAFASINYRFSKQAVFPAQLEDCKGAVRWLRAHAGDYHIDPDRIGAWGSSAGAHLAALVAMTVDDPALQGTVGGNLTFSSGVQCVCDFYGPSDFTKMEEQATAAGIVRDPTKISALLGGSPKEKPDLATAASPVSHVSKSSPPFLILHGGKDKTVPLAQSQELADALRQAGVEVKLIVVPGAAHGAPFSGPQERQEIKDFFDNRLKPSGAPAK